MQHLRNSLFLILFAALITGCGGGGGSTSPYPDNRNGARDWTIMVYMAADNSLEEYAIENINQMEMVGSTAQSTIIVQADRSGQHYTDGKNDWVGARRYYITRDSDASTMHSTLLESMGDQDMASPQTLVNFVNWATHEYPAEHYMLVLWDHGRGWQNRSITPMGLNRQVKAIFADESSGDEMTLTGLTQATQQIPHMDIIAFDACLMGMMEVAYSVKDNADLMVASEENVPGDGLPYQQILSKIASSPTMTPVQVSQAVVDEYIKHASGLSGTFTESAINLASLSQVVSATDQLAQSILANIGTVRTAIRNAQQQTQHYDFDHLYYDDYKDLYDFASRVNDQVANAQVQSAAQGVMASISNTVLYQGNTGGQVVNSHGISIYLPKPGAMLSQYGTMSFAQNTKWDEFLVGY